MKRHARYSAAAAALALAGSILVAVPAGAEDSVGIGIDSGVILGEPSDQQPTTGEGTGLGEDNSEPSPDDQGAGLGENGGEASPNDEGTEHDSAELPKHTDAIGGLQPEASVGPDDFAEKPIYGAEWARGEAIPNAVTIVKDNPNVELFTFETEDRSLFAALLLIDNHKAPAEYRFENAVPEGRTAALHPDGSVRFFDADGNESGGIAAPWALDANGATVPTRYTLDGTTLIQTIDHEGAAYPVAADPAWFIPAVILAIRLAAPTAAVVLSRCGAAQCAAIARTTGSAVYNHVRPRGGSGRGSRPTNTCNMRNRSGC